MECPFKRTGEPILQLAGRDDIAISQQTRWDIPERADFLRRFNKDIVILEFERCEGGRIAGHHEVFEDEGMLSLWIQ